jgi:site-specific recombinase XerD
MENFENNLPKLMKFLFENDVKIYSMSRDIVNFRRFFQIRIQEEEEKEKKVSISKINSEGGIIS